MTQVRRTGPALETMYRFLLWLVPAVEKFPRRQKFLLGDRIQTTALEVLERLIEATYTRARRDTLAEANLGIEKLRFLFRLAKDLHHVNVARYEHAKHVGRARTQCRCFLTLALDLKWGEGQYTRMTDESCC